MDASICSRIYIVCSNLGRGCFTVRLKILQTTSLGIVWSSEEERKLIPIGRDPEPITTPSHTKKSYYPKRKKQGRSTAAVRLSILTIILSSSRAIWNRPSRLHYWEWDGAGSGVLPKMA